jgi:predicted glycosyltransferase
MQYLFFFVHPSKFYVFRNTINILIADGHKVDVIITSKDVLDDLVKQEGWEYTNLFPRGRKMKNIPAIISSALYFVLTIYRLYKCTCQKHYDLFITDDLLVYTGRLKKIPSIVFLDDDISVVKKFSLILSKADYVLSPEITDIGKYSYKKIRFPGYKELAYLHPNCFRPDIELVKQFNPDLDPYFILRLVSLTAYHDVGMKGLSNDNVKKLIALLETKGKVFISSERPLPKEFEKYRLVINPKHIAHILFYANIFVGDSQTMTSEAAVLGTPAFRCNDFVGNISVMDEKEEKYGLSFNYRPLDFDKMYSKIESLLKVENYKKVFHEKRMIMLKDKIDLSSFMIWLFENFPLSIKEIESETFTFERFKLKE